MEGHERITEENIEDIAERIPEKKFPIKILEGILETFSGETLERVFRRNFLEIPGANFNKIKI